MTDVDRAVATLRSDAYYFGEPLDHLLAEIVALMEVVEQVLQARARGPVADAHVALYDALDALCTAILGEQG